MRLFHSLYVVMLFSTRISLSSSYKATDRHDYHPNICGGYCRGSSRQLHPCFDAVLIGPEENERCEWANDHCCPPYGTGSEWPPPTTTTTSTTTDTIIIPAITIPNSTGPSRSVQHSTSSSQWTTTTTTTTITPPTTTEKKEDEDEGSLASWEIVLIMLGAIFLFVIVLGVCFWFCLFRSSEGTNEMYQPWDNYGGMKQPLRPQPNHVRTTAEEEASILHINPEYESQLKEDQIFNDRTFGNRRISPRSNQVMTTPQGVHYAYVYL